MLQYCYNSAGFVFLPFFLLPIFIVLLWLLLVSVLGLNLLLWAIPPAPVCNGVISRQVNKIKTSVLTLYLSALHSNLPGNLVWTLSIWEPTDLQSGDSSNNSASFWHHLSNQRSCLPAPSLHFPSTPIRFSGNSPADPETHPRSVSLSI